MLSKQLYCDSLMLEECCISLQSDSPGSRMEESPKEQFILPEEEKPIITAPFEPSQSNFTVKGISI